MATGLKGEGGEESGEQKGSQRGKKCLTAPPLCQMGVCCGSAFGRLAQSARAARAVLRPAGGRLHGSGAEHR